MHEKAKASNEERRALGSGQEARGKRQEAIGGDSYVYCLLFPSVGAL